MKKIIFMSVLMIILTAVRAYAVELPLLEGEPRFNELAEELAGGGYVLNPAELINTGKDIIIGEVSKSYEIILTIVVLAALSGILTVMQGALKNNSVSEVSFLACFSLIALTAVKCFMIVLEYAKTVIGNLSEFVTKFSPLLLSMVMSSGRASSAMAFKPVLAAAVYVITVVVEKCLVPLIIYGAALSLVNNINGKVQISNYTRMIQSFSRWIMTGVLTMFTGITGIYGFTTPALDALGARAAKFAVGSFVPVVGGLLSESIETVVGGSMLVKNAVGTAGIVSICVICLVPIIKISAIILMLKFAAAAVEPLADKRISGMLQDIAAISVNILAMVITVSVMFVICISIIISATNV